MDTPKPLVGRPRRRPFAAHNARAVVSRAENAARWLRELRWRLDAEQDVLRYLCGTRKADVDYFYRHGLVLEGLLDRLVAALADPVAPDTEGSGDGD